MSLSVKMTHKITISYSVNVSPFLEALPETLCIGHKDSETEKDD